MAAVEPVREEARLEPRQAALAKAAGVSQSQLTDRFPTHADLAYAVLQRAAERQRWRVRRRP